MPLQWKGEGVLKKGDCVEEMQAKGHVIFVLYLYLMLVAEEENKPIVKIGNLNTNYPIKFLSTDQGVWDKSWPLNLLSNDLFKILK